MTSDTKAVIVRLYTQLRSTYKVAHLTGYHRSTIRKIVSADCRVTMSPVGRPRKVAVSA